MKLAYKMCCKKIDDNFSMPKYLRAKMIDNINLAHTFFRYYELKSAHIFVRANGLLEFFLFSQNIFGFSTKLFKTTFLVLVHIGLTLNKTQQ